MKIKNLNKIEMIYAILGVVMLFFLPLKYKYYWLFLYPLIFIKWSKIHLMLAFILAIIITPNFKYLRVYGEKDFFSSYIVNFLNKNNIEEFNNGNIDKFKEFNLIYGKNICYFYYNNCEIDIQKKNGGIYFPKYQFIDGNITYINYDKRTIYNINNYLSKIDIRNKTIFIPNSAEEIIFYNYKIFKDYALEKINGNLNECELLLYGSQNGWFNYRNKLITKLKNDSNNSCIESLEKDLPKYNILLEEKIKDRNNLINFLENSKN